MSIIGYNTLKTPIQNIKFSTIFFFKQSIALFNHEQNGLTTELEMTE